MKNFVKKTAATALSVLGILSAMPSAFCAPGGKNNEKGHIDPFNMMVVGKHLNSVKDICNLTMVNKKYEDIVERYHLNPVAITSRKQLALYPKMETCHIGRCESEEDFISTFPNDKIKTLVYLPGSFDVDQFEKVVNENKIYADKWGREFRLESENPMDGCRITFTKDGQTIVFMFSPYVDGVLTSLIGYNSLLKECGIVGEELTAASVATSGVLSIPSSVESIGRDAFYGCENLTEVTIPSSVKSIGDDAFRSCKKLNQVTIQGPVKSIGSYAFAHCCRLHRVTIQGSVDSIGSGAFADCCGLWEVTIQGPVKSIGNYVFTRCNRLTKVTIQGSVDSIERDAFSGCKNLSEVTIQDGVKSIESCAFAFCENLTQVTIQGSVDSVERDSFVGCKNLTYIRYNGGVYTMDSFKRAFAMAKLYKTA